MAGITYDPDADVLYVLLQDVAVDHSKTLDDLRIIDYSTDSGVRGIEFICASDGIDLSDLPFAQKVEQLIGESGPTFRIFA